MIFRALLILLGLYLVWRVLKPILQPPKPPEPPEGVDDVLVEDPVCGLHVPRKEAVMEVLGRREYYFCSPKCRDEFRTQKH